MKRKKWTRSELIIAFYQYCLTPFGRIHSKNPEIMALSQRLGRSPNALAMKMCNFASFDPAHKQRNVKGLAHVANSDRKIWKEFHGDWDKLLNAYQEEANNMNLPVITEESELEEDIELPHKTEIQKYIKIRTAQTFFRRSVLASYSNKCAICSLENMQLLNASHIIPWSVNEKLRADPRNGLSLCALHDRAFDRGLITLDEEMRLVLSDKLKKQSQQENCTMYRFAFIELEGNSILLPDRFLPLTQSLEYHRNKVFNK